MASIHRVHSLIRQLRLPSEDGQTVIEYALVVAMVSVVVVGGLFAMAQGVQTNVFGTALDRLADALP